MDLRQRSSCAALSLLKMIADVTVIHRATNGLGVSLGVFSALTRDARVGGVSRRLSRLFRERCVDRCANTTALCSVGAAT